MSQKLNLDFPTIAPPEREWAAEYERLKSRIRIACNNHGVLVRRLDTCNNPSIVIATMRSQSDELQTAINDLEKHLAMKSQAVEAGKRQTTLF